MCYYTTANYQTDEEFNGKLTGFSSCPSTSAAESLLKTYVSDLPDLDLFNLDQQFEDRMDYFSGECQVEPDPPVSPLNRFRKAAKKVIKRQRRARKNLEYLMRYTLRFVRESGSGGGYLQGFYMMEKLDVKHRFGTALKHLSEDYAEHTKTMIDPDLFLDWLAKQSDDDLRQFMRSKGYREEDIDKTLGGVKYLDKVDRKKYRLHIHSGFIKQNGVPFDTTSLSTYWSGKGFAIWTMSPIKAFYAGSHIQGTFHHSSFLAGQVMGSAGEMVVKDGRLKLISAKSGHYKPSMTQFMNGLRALQEKGVTLGPVLIRLFRKDPATQVPLENKNPNLKDSYTGKPINIGWGIPVYVKGYEYMNNLAVRNKYSVWGKP